MDRKDAVAAGAYSGLVERGHVSGARRGKWGGRGGVAAEREGRVGGDTDEEYQTETKYYYGGKFQGLNSSCSMFCCKFTLQ